MNDEDALEDSFEEGWWHKNPRDIRTGCAVVMLGAALGWLAVGGIAWLVLRWWNS